jgi:hypothetical protein
MRRRRRQHDLRTRLATDAGRVSGFMAAVLADAQRIGAELPEGVAACVIVWRSWDERLAAWARDQDEKR